MTMRITKALVATVAVLAASSASALSISALPASQEVLATDGVATVDIVMDFETQSIGGGIIFDFSGPITFQSFTPSAYFQTLNTTPDDTDFTGFGTNNKPASAEFEIHLASFAGIGGQQTLGTLTFAVTDLGTAIIDISISPDIYYGAFYDLLANPQDVALNDAQIESVVPLPATAWLFATGMGLVGLWRRRR